MTAAVRSDGLASPRPQLWRIRDRATFLALRSGRRGRVGPVSVTFSAPPPGASVTPPRVAFTVGKAAGGAVVRNRIRRRLRAGLRQLLVDGRLPAGAYLVGGGAEVARMPWATLASDLDAAIVMASKGSS